MTETTQQFLARRKKELLAQISALKGQLGALESELAQINKFEAAQAPASLASLATTHNQSVPNGLMTANALAALSKCSVLSPETTNALAAIANSTKFSALNPEATTAIARMTESMSLTGSSIQNALARVIGHPNAARYAHMTIKQMVVQALFDHFPVGATAAQIREYIKDGYGRAVEPASLRPQMHRLKADRVLIHNPEGDLWDLPPAVRKNPSFIGMETKDEL